MTVFEHDHEPKLSTIQPDAGIGIGEYLADCWKCNRLVTGNDDYCRLVEADEKERFLQ